MNYYKYLFLPTILLLIGCSNISNPEVGKEQIMNAIGQQQQSWNNGNIEGFMDAYWNNDSMMFVSGDKVSYGWQQVTDNYKKNYNSKELMGELVFDVIKIESLSADAYLTVGSWKLYRVSGDIGGKFTLVWKKIEGEWKIVVDHTS